MVLKDKKAVVTGGFRGIGRAIVNELAKNGCDVVFTDIKFPDDDAEKAAEELKRDLNLTDAEIFGFKADASSFDEAQATIDFAVEKLGGLDILINNAGITRDNLMLRMNESEFDIVINANLKSVFNYIKASLKPMIGQKYGKIVNIASVVGIIGNAGQANYASSKAGVIGLTKSSAKELASRNITVNAIAPGFIETDMTNKLNDKQKEALAVNIPLKRLGKPDDVAKVVKFLCSSDADYITGQVIPVDGGMVM